MNEGNLQRVESELSKTSFVAEMKCLKILKKKDWDVENNFIFIDPETHKSREIDLFACKAPTIFDDKSCLTVYALIECKKNNYPLIFFPAATPRGNVLALIEMIFQDAVEKSHGDGYDPLLSDLRWKSRFWQGQTYSWFFDKEEKGLQSYDAVAKLAKATKYITEGLRENDTPMDPPLIFTVYQAIVVDGLICRASLGKGNVHLSTMNHIALATTFNSPSVRANMLVDVVKLEYFAKYVKVLESEIENFVRISNNFKVRRPSKDPI